MAVKKTNSVLHYDSYGRQITRESEMLRKVNCDCYSNNMQSSSTMGIVKNTDYNIDNSGQVTSPLPMESVKYNGCKSLYNSINNTAGTGNNGTGNGNDSNIPDCSCNNAFFFKYNNLRIRYVGFIFCNINYIVDIDNRKVLFKGIKDSKYTSLNRKVSVATNSITKAYTVAFNLVGCRYNAEVEIYPNNIDKCSVVITDLNNYSKEMLDKCYTNIEFFDMKNMLDNNGNLITYIDYSDVFKLTEDEISSIYNYPDAISLIYRLLQNVQCQKDLVFVIKQLLVDIRNRYMEESTGCDCGCMGDDSIDEEFPVDGSCNCGNHHGSCGNKPKPSFDFSSITPEDIAGTYIADNGDKFTLSFDNGVLTVRTLYLGYNNEDGGQLYLVTEDNEVIKTNDQLTSIQDVTWKEEFMIDDHFNPTGILVKILDKDANIITTMEYKYKKKYLVCIDDSSHTVYKREYTGEPDLDLDVNFIVVDKKGKKKVISHPIYKKGICEDLSKTEDGSINISFTIPDVSELNYVLIEVTGKINDTITKGISLVTGEEYDRMIDIYPEDNKIYGVVKVTEKIFDYMLKDEKLIVRMLPNKDAEEEIIHTIHFNITDI